MIQKAKNVLARIDRFVNQFGGPILQIGRRYFLLFSTSFVLGLALIAAATLIMQKTKQLGALITQDMEKIDTILTSIDEHCQILSIRQGSWPVDFLTIKNFAGSEVGCLNLAHPKGWQGPYTQQLPAINGIPYQLIQAKDGVFIAPGNDVMLPNGLVMGRDVMLGAHASIGNLIQPGGPLWHKDKALARRVTCHIGDWTILAPTNKENFVHQLDQAIEELNAAIPYARLGYEVSV